MYVSDASLRSDAKRLLEAFVESIQSIPYAVRFASKIIMSLQRKERPNLVGVYPCENMIHRLVFQERLSRTILSEVLPIEDVHKKFISNYILASTDPKLKNPVIVEFVRALIAVGHPCPRQENVVTFSEEKEVSVEEEEVCIEDDSLPPGLTNAILNAKKENEKTSSTMSKRLSDIERKQCEIHEMMETKQRHEENDARLCELEMELSRTRDEIRKRDRDEWSHIFARTLSEELEKDFIVNSRKSNRVTWSPTSRQRLFGDSMIDQEDEDDDDMTEGVTSMLNSFRSVSPSKTTTARYTSPLRRNKSRLSKSFLSSPLKTKRAVVSQRSKDMSGIYSILDRLNELSNVG